MKKNLASNALFLAAAGALLFAMLMNPPGGVRWEAFFGEQASFVRKVSFLAGVYVWPAVLSFFAIVLFQLQFRLASSGVRGRVVFAVCVAASGAMLLGMRTISLSASSMPSYVLGMASGYTVMSRLYAMRLRTFFGKVRMPWPVWRGDRVAVEQINSAARMRAMQAGGGRPQPSEQAAA